MVSQVSKRLSKFSIRSFFNTGFNADDLIENSALFMRFAILDVYYRASNGNIHVGFGVLRKFEAKIFTLWDSDRSF